MMILMAFSVVMQKSQISKLAHFTKIKKKELLTLSVLDLEKYQLHHMCENSLKIYSNSMKVSQSILQQKTQKDFLMLEGGSKKATMLTKKGCTCRCKYRWNGMKV